MSEADGAPKRPEWVRVSVVGRMVAIVNALARDGQDGDRYDRDKTWTRRTYIEGAVCEMTLELYAAILDSTDPDFEPRPPEMIPPGWTWEEDAGYLWRQGPPGLPDQRIVVWQVAPDQWRSYGPSASSHGRTTDIVGFLRHVAASADCFHPLRPAAPLPPAAPFATLRRIKALLDRYANHDDDWGDPRARREARAQATDLIADALQAPDFVPARPDALRPGWVWDDAGFLINQSDMAEAPVVVYENAPGVWHLWALRVFLSPHMIAAKTAEEAMLNAESGAWRGEIGAWR